MGFKFVFWPGQDGAGNRHVSVYRGSIFEIGVHAPAVVLKLLYHWSCQTNIPNVAQWVKVDNNTIDKFFTHCRAVCTAAVQVLLIYHNVAQWVKVDNNTIDKFFTHCRAVCTAAVQVPVPY
jgi:hypothetical protein